MVKKSIVAVAALVLCFCFGGSVNASLTIVSAVGGQPGSGIGINYANFDSLALGGGGGVDGDITVSFVPDAQVVQGSASGYYAAPYLSNNNGANFGGQGDGVNTTRYITSGKDGSPNLGAAATLTFTTNQLYFGLLWGSVDNYNTLEFFDENDVLVGTVVGSQVDATATGDQGINGTFYVNINSTVGFRSVVATSSNYAFEFDNVAYSQSRLTVPEPGSIAIWSLMGLVGCVVFRRKPANKK